MPDLTEYKCPACGGAMEFNSKLQKMKCPYCDTEMEVEEFQELHSQANTSDSTNQWTKKETAGIHIYICESCGGQIAADESTGASSCPFCGSPVIMSGQFSDDLKPDYIIPFKLDKKEAKAAYQKHLQGKNFLPGIFRSENHIDEIKGIYVPFWLFDTDATADMKFNGERIRTWTSGDTEYTEHEFYQAQRTGEIRFSHVPADGSKKMDDILMESIEPYDFSEAVPFQSAYLAGYLANRYDVSAKERLKRARERILRSTEISFEETVQGYHSVTTQDSHITLHNTSSVYALYPVWLLNTTWKNKKYTFAMNGQTGKMVGDLPFDKQAFWKYVATRGVLIGTILSALTCILRLL